MCSSCGVRLPTLCLILSLIGSLTWTVGFTSLELTVLICKMEHLPYCWGPQRTDVRKVLGVGASP